jgi:hypothetical protein
MDAGKYTRAARTSTVVWLILSCASEDKPTSPTDCGIAPERLLAVTATPDTALADGASLVTVTASIPSNLYSGKRTVDFTITSGSFSPSGNANASAAADACGTAIVLVRSPKGAGLGVIGAAFGPFKAVFDTITFRQAWPEKVVVDAGVFQLPAGAASETAVVVHLLRSTGGVSEGVPVDFVATDTLGVRLGGFRRRQYEQRGGGHDPLLRRRDGL